MKKIIIELDGENRLEKVDVDGHALFDKEKLPNGYGAVLEIRLDNYSGEGRVRLTTEAFVPSIKIAER